MEGTSYDESSRSRKSKSIYKGRLQRNEENIYVLILAHPDDESMFFLPTIRALQQQSSNNKVWLLCLTTGDYDGLGKIRSKELEITCRDILHLDQLIVLDHPTQMPDHPTRTWSIEYVSRIIQKSLCDALAQSAASPVGRNLHLITFDAHGVSGHINHRDTFRAVQSVVHQQHQQERPQMEHQKLPPLQAWSLETIHNPLVKYIPLVCWCYLFLHWCFPSIGAQHNNNLQRRRRRRRQ